jgi:hypothetical protein
MDQAKLNRVRVSLVSWAKQARTDPGSKYKLDDMGDGHYRLTFEREGADKTFNLSAQEVDAIDTGNESARDEIRTRFQALVRVG